MLEPFKLEQINAATGRTYRVPTGKEYPSITTVLSRIPNDGIQKWVERVGEEEAERIKTESADIGTAFHDLCEQYLLNNLSEYSDIERRIKLTSLNNSEELIEDLFFQVKPILDDFGTVHATELPMWSDYLRLAGTTDCIADYKGNLAIVDFKNARKPKRKEWIKNYFLQGSAYAQMLYERYGIVAKKIVVIVAVWKGEPQVFEENVLDHYDDLINVMKKYNPMWS